MDQSITVSYYNLIWEEEKKTGLIQEDGTFRIIFDLPIAQDIYITSGTDIYISSFVIPGDTIQLNLEYQLTHQKFQGIPSPFYMAKFETAFVGTCKARQEKFFDFFYKWIGKNNVIDKITSNNKGLINQINTIEPLLKSYFKEDKTSKNLYEWGYNYLFYNILYRAIDNKDTIDLKNLKYPVNSKIVCRDLYMAYNRMEFKTMESKDFNIGIAKKIGEAVLSGKFVKLSSEEKKVIESISLNRHLSKKDSLLARDIEGKLKPSDKFSKFRDSLVFYSTVNQFKNQLPQYFSDRLIANEIIKNLHDASTCSLIIDKKVRDYTISRIKSIAKNELNIKEYIFPENELISNLVKRNKGKAIYIDIWATWCAPCRAEFSKYPEIISKYGNKIKFIFLCETSPENTYLDVLKNIPFNAEHYFLTAKQKEEINVNYKVSGIPHHLFIRPNGTIVNKTFGPLEKDKLYELFDQR